MMTHGFSIRLNFKNVKGYDVSRGRAAFGGGEGWSEGWRGVESEWKLAETGGKGVKGVERGVRGWLGGWQDTTGCWPGSPSLL